MAIISISLLRVRAAEAALTLAALAADHVLAILDKPTPVRPLPKRDTPTTPATAPVAPVATPDPAGVFSADEMPALDAIEDAAADYDQAAIQARGADRGKRKARKLLDRLPAGTYGRWQVERVESNRQTADLDAIRALFAENGLGPVPMRPAAPSLKVTRVSVPTAALEVMA
ncbi:hypothetical protein [Frankia sp. Cj3]|uniref:hypothetical protein n=1 Tax=Frankia sp. Cj3 TaxID=2880976 RepID=UPI001EF52BC7|nr:hypothetical protein [Frankia sp. Cj3]